MVMDEEALARHREAWGLDENMNPPPLHPELVPYLVEGAFGPCVKHPLVFSVPYSEMLNGHVNMQYEKKKKALARALEEQDWGSYLFLHERPHRVDAFLDIHVGMTDQQYWERLSSLWTDTENLWQNKGVWRVLLRNPKRLGSRRKFFMDDEERAQLDQIPQNPIKIYRGTSAPDQMGGGLSWTLKRTKAQWFAKRFANMDGHTAGPCLLSGTVERSKVIAYVNGRGENEIVVFPEDVKNITCNAL